MTDITDLHSGNPEKYENLVKHVESVFEEVLADLANTLGDRMLIRFKKADVGLECRQPDLGCSVPSGELLTVVVITFRRVCLRELFVSESKAANRDELKREVREEIFSALLSQWREEEMEQVEAGKYSEELIEACLANMHDIVEEVLRPYISRGEDIVYQVWYHSPSFYSVKLNVNDRPTQVAGVVGTIPGSVVDMVEYLLGDYKWEYEQRELKRIKDYIEISSPIEREGD